MVDSLLQKSIGAVHSGPLTENITIMEENSVKKAMTGGFAFLLVWAMLLVGCGKKEPTVTPGTKEEESQSLPEEDLYAELPQGSFDNQDFVILNNISDYAITTMVTDDLSTPINSAIYSRNEYVKQELEIELKVKELPYAENKELMERLVVSDLGGENEYDICYNESWAQAILAQRGVYKSVNTYAEYLNLEKPWWYSTAMEELSVFNNLFYVVGDMQLMWYESIWCLAFNTDVLEGYGIASPYEDVENNTWTFERMHEISSQTHVDGASPNHYGVASHIAFASAMLSAAGIRICQQDEVDGLVLSELGVHFSDVYDAILQDFFTDNGNDMENYIRTSYDSESYTSGKFATKDTQWVFEEGRATFLGGTIGDMRLYVAGKPIPYGIVPLPKYTSDQQQYISYVYEGGALCGIPNNLGSEERLRRVCTVMEWLCAISYRTVKPEYYSVILQGKIANDPTASRMLDIVLGLTDQGITRLELDNIFRLGTASVIQRRISDNKNAVSGVKSNLPLINGNLNNVLDAFRPEAETAPEP